MEKENKRTDNLDLFTIVLLIYSCIITFLFYIMSNRNKNQFTDLTYSRFFMMLLQFKGFLDYIESFSISFEQAYHDRRSFHRLLRLFKHYSKTHKDTFDFSDICEDDYDYHQIYRLIIKSYINEKKKNT